MSMQPLKMLLVVFLSCYLTDNDSLKAQINYTANDQIRPYEDPFSYGANMGYYAPWLDEQIADIGVGNGESGVSGVGVTSLRPALFAHFLEQWGYDIRVNAFKHYEQLGVKNNTVFIGYPSPDQRSESMHCNTHRSELFANLYEPIWDGGANGTPVNEGNDYALYVYKMVSKYKDYIKIYEIWNEPDFDYSGNAWKTADMAGSWWQNDPEPCGTALRAPVTHYVRLLRVSYEVIKSLSPESYVATGGLGFPSYLDALLRNTDNPTDGSVSADYPLGGGAYFDVMSFHSYPHIDGSLRTWNNDKQGFDWFRHSDAAADGVVRLKRQFEEVLHRYNYNGRTYPEKVYIITECNIPRKGFGDFIGSNEAQRNFILKTLIEVQKVGVKQLHVYQMGELNHFNEARNEFDLMGLYEKLENTPPSQIKKTDMGIAYKTISDQLNGFFYNEQQTRDLLLPKGVRGAAFVSATGQTRYVLWAKTPNDRSEVATASYTFPSLLNVQQMTVREWNSSSTQDSLLVKGSKIQLTGAPVFIDISAEENKGNTDAELVFNCFPNPYVDSLNILFKLSKESEVNLKVYDVKGRLIRTYHDKTLLPPGIYQHFFEMDVPSGIYICKLETNTQKISRRVVKMKPKK